MLLALACWLVPFKTLAQETGITKTKAVIITVQQDSDYTSADIIIKDNAIQPNQNLSLGKPNGNPTRIHDRRHSTRAENQIPVEALTSYLEERHSPLAAMSAQLLQSPYYSTIIGICTIEQYGCTKAPGNNYWGIMGSSGLRKFSSLEGGIEAIDALLARYEDNGHNTIESLNGYYVQPASQNWLNTVLNTKELLESLQ